MTTTADAPPLHAFAAELVIILSRQANARSVDEMEDYMRALVVRFHDLVDHSDAFDITVSPVRCCAAGCTTCSAEPSVLTELRRLNIRSYIEHQAMLLATDAQRQRMTCPEKIASETLDIARGVLFAPFREFTRRPKRYADAVKHAPGCSGPDIRWTTTRSSTFSSEESRALWAINQAAATAAQHEWLSVGATEPVVLELEVRAHRGECQGCGAAYVDHGVLVTIPFCERTLSREYLL